VTVFAVNFKSFILFLKIHQVRFHHEFNVERYELSKSRTLLFNHPQGTHDDRFWTIALAVYAADPVYPASRPIARTI
jgi:hypothetical protein